MKALIVDDEPLARARLRRLLEDIDGMAVVGEAGNGEEALARSEALQPDIVFLDIRMPGMGGLEAARRLAEGEHPPAVIFTTAYDEHALEAFDASAAAYLLKPIRQERLQEAIERSRRLNRAQRPAAAPAGTPAPAVGRSHLSASIGGRLQRVPLEEVLYFQAEQKYVVVRHRGGQLLIDDSLKSLEAEFGDRFLRVHRNSLVAMAQVQGLERIPGGRYEVFFRDIDDRVEVSRRLASSVRRRLQAS